MALNVSASQFSIGDFQRDYLFVCRIGQAGSLKDLTPPIATSPGTWGEPGASDVDAVGRALSIVQQIQQGDFNMRVSRYGANNSEEVPTSQLLVQSSINLSTMNEALDLIIAKGIMPEAKTAVIPVKSGGESYNLSGVDESAKTGDFVFRCPVATLATIYAFFEALKGTTGDFNSHAALPKLYQIFDFEVDFVDTSKTYVTYGRILRNCAIYGLKPSDPDKEGSGLATLNITMAWDRNERVVPGSAFPGLEGFTELSTAPLRPATVP